MKKLSSEKTGFIKFGFPVVICLVFAFFLYLTFFKGFIIMVPIMGIYLIGILIVLRRAFKLVDFYVDYEKGEFKLDNLKGNVYTYKFDELNYLKHNKRSNKVEVRFYDKKTFNFYTKNFWSLPGLGYSSDIDGEIEKIKRLNFSSKTIL
jgi:hypothetical protein